MCCAFYFLKLKLNQAWTSGEMKYRAVISTRGSVGEVVENHNKATMSPQPTQHVRGETLMLSYSRSAKGKVVRSQQNLATYFFF